MDHLAAQDSCAKAAIAVENKQRQIWKPGWTAGSERAEATPHTVSTLLTGN